MTLHKKIYLWPIKPIHVNIYILLLSKAFNLTYWYIALCNYYSTCKSHYVHASKLYLVKQTKSEVYIF